MRLFLRLLMRLFGWRIDDQIPPETEHCILIAAPHTSNWDFIVTILAFNQMRIPYRFTIKREWMRPPIGWLIGALGGLGIDRRPKQPGEARPSMTAVMIGLLQQHPRLAMLVTPEGTRARNSTWKTGFYHAALGAGVPIALGYVDYRDKRAGVGSVIHPSGDLEADMRRIMAFYKQKHGKHPERFALDSRYVD